MTFFPHSRQKLMGLIVALDDAGGAEGQVFWDDGESIGELQLPVFSTCRSEKPHPQGSGCNPHKLKIHLFPATVSKVVVLGEFLHLLPAHLDITL